MAKSYGVKFAGDLETKNSSDVSVRPIPRMQLQAAFLPTKLDNICALSVNSETCQDRMTSVICTLGKSTNDINVLFDLIEAGMNIALINRECGDQDSFANTINMVRVACNNYSEKLGVQHPLAIAMNTKGAHMHTGAIEDGQEFVVLEKNDTIKVTNNQDFQDKCSNEVIYVDYPDLLADMQPGYSMYMSVSSMRFIVQEVGPDDVTCVIDSGGKLWSDCTVTFPDVNIVKEKSLTTQDRADINFAVTQNLDIIFVSYVRNADTIQEVRDLLGSRGNSIRVVASIEDGEGYRNVDEILAVADGIFVARNSLSVNMKQETMFTLQREIISKCNQARKPVIIGSQMLKSMFYNPRATRPEISDVAYAVLDGADCLLLNEETATGFFPVRCLDTMIAICKEAEGAIWQKETFGILDKMAEPPTDPLTAIAIATVEGSMQVNASAIIVVASAPKSAQVISSFRPRCPIIAVTRYASAARKLQLYKSVYPVTYTAPVMKDWTKDIDARCQFGISYGKCRGYIKKNDAVILVSGWQQGGGFTNTIRFIYVSSAGKEID